jgi:hypothetical protein
MALSQVQQLQQICSSSRHNVNSVIAPLARHPLASNASLKLTQRNTAAICHAVESEQQQKVQAQPEAAVPGMAAYLDSLKWAKDGLVPVIVQVGTIPTTWQPQPVSTRSQGHSLLQPGGVQLITLESVSSQPNCRYVGIHSLNKGGMLDRPYLLVVCVCCAAARGHRRVADASICRQSSAQ